MVFFTVDTFWGRIVTFTVVAFCVLPGVSGCGSGTLHLQQTAV